MHQSMAVISDVHMVHITSLTMCAAIHILNRPIHCKCTMQPKTAHKFVSTVSVM